MKNQISLRECINRKVEYSVVIYSCDNQRWKDIVYGHTTLIKEMKRIMKLFDEVPTDLLITHHTEQRHMTMETFLNHSIITKE